MSRMMKAERRNDNRRVYLPGCGWSDVARGYARFWRLRDRTPPTVDKHNIDPAAFRWADRVLGHGSDGKST